MIISEPSNSTAEAIQKRNAKIEENKALVEQFPFLVPIDAYSGRVPNGYDYSYTVLDYMPSGWRKNFGIKMCKEIKKELVANGDINQFKITDIKEKYGALRVYDYGSTQRIEKKILPKYGRLSERTCGICGRPATKIAIAWIFPLCDDCAKSEKPDSFVDIEYYYGE